MKCELAQEFVVGGFTEPQGNRAAGALSWWFITKLTALCLRRAQIDTGFNIHVSILRTQLDKLELISRRLREMLACREPKVGNSLRAHWVTEIVVASRFNTGTKHNKPQPPETSLYAQRQNTLTKWCGSDICSSQPKNHYHNHLAFLFDMQGVASGPSSPETSS